MSNKNVAQVKAYKIIAGLLCLCIVLCSIMVLFPNEVSAQDGWGTYGNNISWHFYEKKGLLEIKGKGLMQGGYTDHEEFEKGYDYAGYVPWGDYKSLTKKITIGKGITGICDNAFSGFSAATEISIANTVEVIGRYAFSETGVKKLEIPKGVKYLSFSSFHGCENLTSVKIPGTVKTVPLSCFSFCKKLKNVKLSEGIKEIIHPFEETAIEHISIPSSVTKLDAAFYKCRQLKEAYIPKTVKEITGYLFFACGSLLYVDYESSCDIEEDTFGGCSSLQTVKIGSGPKKIGYFSFWDCRSLQSVLIPKSVKDINPWAFHELKQKINFYTYKNSAAYDFAGTHANIDYYNVTSQKGKSQWNSLWSFFNKNNNNVAISKVKEGKKSSVTVSVKKLAKTPTNIEVRICGNENVSPALVIKTFSGKKSSITITSWRNDTRPKYYAYARAVMVVGGQTYYTDWSKVKAFKMS